MQICFCVKIINFKLLFFFSVRSIKEPKDKNHHHNVNNTVQMSTPEKAFKQAQDLLYAMAAKTPVCNTVLFNIVSVA